MRLLRLPKSSGQKRTVDVPELDTRVMVITGGFA
jgi:hypothetical protein